MRSRLVGSDPARARLANSVAVTAAVALSALASWLIVRFGVSDHGFLIAGILAAVQLGTSIKDPTPRDRLITTALAGIPLVVAPAVAVLLDPWRNVEIAVFIALAGAATWSRRFSPRVGELGIIAFLAYFFALFLRPPLAELGGFLLIFVCVWATALVVRLVMARERPVHQLAILFTELRATSQTALTAAGEVDPASRHSAAFDAAIGHVDDVAKAITGWQAHFSTAQAIGVAPELLASRVLDARIDVEQAALEIAALVRGAGTPDVLDQLSGPLADLDTMLDRHADRAGLDAAAERARRLLDEGDGATPVILTAILLARATLAHRRLHELDPNGGYALIADEAGLPAPAREVREDSPSGRDTVPADDDKLRELDGARAPGGHRWSWRNWRTTDRLAVQAMVAAGLAAFIGELIDASRWYWAVMTAFLIFIGSTTRGAVLTRASHQVAGTLIGVVVGLGVGVLLDGPSTWHIVLALVSVFGALYLGPVKQWIGSFFSTLVVVAMYGLLGMLHPHILTVRLEETAAGAAVGVACAYIVFTASSRPVLHASIGGYLDAVRSLVGGVGQAFTGAVPAPDLLTGTERLDAAQLRLVGAVDTMSVTFVNGRWSLAAQLQYLMRVSTRSAERASKAAIAVLTRDPDGVLSGPGAVAFTDATEHVRGSVEVARAVLIGRGRHAVVDPDETSVVDGIEHLDAPPHSAAVQAMLMLSRVNWAMLRAAQLKRKS